MTRSSRLKACLSVGLMTALAVGVPSTASAADPQAPVAANPCAPKALNPCAPKANPCAPGANVGPDINPALVRRPSGTQLFKASHAELVREGKALFADEKLSTSGMSCNSCHEGNGGFSPSFAKPYPHPIAMVAERVGVASPVQLDEMVQFCMLVPMAAKPLPWGSRTLAALTAYFSEIQKAVQVETRKPGSPP